ncbi:MAG: hypothetical protein GY788_00635, partial [bacterium]|nr:hypothetical protein [bacterium]
MIEVGLIGVAAGIAGALLFLSSTSGTALALPLFAICGLPIAIAGLGWNLLTAIVAAGIAGIVVTGALSPASAAVYLLLFAAPVLWMSRLAGLSRSTGDNGEISEHFPIGGILFQGALATACGVIAVGTIGGFDPVATTTDFTNALVDLLSQSSNGAPPPTAAEVEPL